MFNFTTDGDLRVNGMRVVKNMDDVLFYHSTLEGAIKELEKFLEFCKKKNLKLKPSKFVIGEEVEFGGALITSEKVRSKNVLNILPKSQRVQAFQNMRRPRTRKEVQIFWGLMTSKGGGGRGLSWLDLTVDRFFFRSFGKMSSGWETVDLN